MSGISSEIKIITPPTVFKPVGRCIYCGAEGGDLRKEHIIPFGLGGNLILPEASCRTCERLTCRAETHVLQHMLGIFRARVGFPTRNPKKRTGEIEVDVKIAEGVHEKHKIPVKDFPQFLVMPRFAFPRILQGLPNIDGITVKELWTYHPQDEIPPDIPYVAASIRMDSFCKMLAKIGHAITIARYGWDITKSFRPMLPRLILEDTLDGYVIGGIPDHLPEPGPTKNGHELGFLETDKHLIGRIRLFAAFGAPVYFTVFGQRSIMA